MWHPVLGNLIIEPLPQKADNRFVPHSDGVDAPPDGIEMCHAGIDYRTRN